jgi:hypothetical protein
MLNISPLPPERLTDDELTRFVSKFQVGPTGCWLWTAGKFDSGYAAFWLRNKTRRGHIVAYEHCWGPVPAGLQLDHVICDTQHCVCPWHVVPTTPQINTQRRSDRRARNRFCPQGHPLYGDNLYIDPRGNRQCRVCRKVAYRKWRQT